MTRILTIIIFFVAFPSWAQEVRVRSGEHGDFTRVVLDLPAELDWSVEQISSSAIDVIFEQGDLSFDVSRALERLSDGRVTGISDLSEGRGVRIALGCACVPRSYLATDRMLVVDLRLGEFVTREILKNQPSAKPIGQASEADSTTSFPSGVRIGQNPGIGLESGENSLLPSFSPVASRSEQTASPDTAPAEGINPRQFEQMLAEQLATAATDGLLDSAMRYIPKPEENEATVSDPFSSKETLQGTQSAPAPAVRALETAISGRVPGDMQSRVRIGGSGCVPDQELDLASWGGEDPLKGSIPELRGKLFGEFDRLDHEAMIKLARAYISIGFGTEARALLDLELEGHESVLYALARIVDGDTDRAGVFAGQGDCDGVVSFWALIGSKDLPTNSAINENAILATFEGLPLRLRTLLGPRLATRFAEEGLPEPARNVLARLERATGGVNEDMMFSEAQIDRIDGSHADAHQVLNEIAVKPGPNAPEAMVQAIELATENRETVNERLADLSGAYSTELRDTEQGPELWLAHLRALTANGQYDEGFGNLFDQPTYPETIRAKAATDLLTLLTEQAHDTAFLKHALAYPDRYDGVASPQSALLVARRLLDLGLPQPAARWLDFAGIDKREPQVRILRAMAHLAQREPEQAEISLVGLEGEKILGLRAKARRMMGDYHYAAEAYNSLGDIQDARTSAWLAGDPSLAMEGEPDVLSAAMQMREEQIPDPLTNAPSLAIAEILAGSGAETVNTIRALLEATRIPAE
ncbi:hypothetical protein [Citreicella sp. C3M06]|uniref:hypothetical protein n=1 Tax=Citreicella sp. C3M06 TaxID=2841564 RepID=UPI002091392B|nr:hypothetical protein [Citreicella sp. C3M06]